nr:hypothetical protein [Desulfobacterales bacterium]
MKNEIKKRILEEITQIPKRYLNDTVIKETIRCLLFAFLKENGLRPIPSFRVPRYPEGPVDMIGVTNDHAIVLAFCTNPFVELKDVKSLERVESERKFVITFSPHSQKVKESTFFLKPGIEHINIYGE